MIIRTGEIERGKCAFCAKEADFFIKSFESDKEVYLCGTCLLTKWIPLIQKLYESLSNIFLNDMEHQ